MIILPEGAPVTGRIIGIDEAGRGCMAGPLVVGAVEWPWPEESLLSHVVADSKTLSEAMMGDIFDNYIDGHVNWAVDFIEPGIIDAHGLTHAAYRGCFGAIGQVIAHADRSYPWDAFVFDGTPGNWGLPQNNTDTIPRLAQFMVRGDQHVEAISAASICAKVMRDRYMRKFDNPHFYPWFTFGQHKGYITQQHMAELNEFGPIPGVHRFTYKPVREYLVANHFTT